MKKCVKCDLSFDDDKKFCNSCGSQLISNIDNKFESSKPGKKCVKCDLTFDNDEKFCKNCGSQLILVKNITSEADAKRFVFEEKLKKNQLDINLLLEYAKYLFDSKSYIESISILLRIMALDDKNYFAMNLLFICFIELKQYEEAFEIGEKLLLKYDKDLPLLEKQVFLSEALNNEEYLFELSNRLISINSNNICGLTNIVIYLLRKNKIEKAIPICKKLIELGSNAPIFLIYAGIDYFSQDKFDIAIECLEKAYSISSDRNKEFDNPHELINRTQKDIHSNRAKLYWTYCLCITNEKLLKIERMFNSVDFNLLKEFYLESDENIAIKTISYIVNHEINFLNKEDIESSESIKRRLNSLEFYFTDFSIHLIAECWYNTAIKEFQLGLFESSLDFCQKAISLIPAETKYKEKEHEIENIINNKKSKQKKNRIITFVSIIGAIIISLLSVKYINKYIENDTWVKLKRINSITSYKDYLNKYPKGVYEDDAKHYIDQILWKTALNAKTYEAYKQYAVDSYFKEYSNQADSLEQIVIWNNAVKENTYEAYQKNIELFPKGNFFVKVDNIVDEKLWQKTLLLKTEESYNSYLKRFPKGKYVKQANIFLDENLWNSTKNQTNLSAFENYKSNFPNGNHISEANSKIEYYQAIDKENQINSTNSNNSASDNSSMYQEGYQMGITMQDYGGYSGMPEDAWKLRHSGNMNPSWEKGYQAGWYDEAMRRNR